MMRTMINTLVLVCLAVAVGAQSEKVSERSINISLRQCNDHCKENASGLDFEGIWNNLECRCKELQNHVSTRSQKIAEENLANLEWWKKTNFYHIYVRSFKDSDGDGEGDLRGIIQELDYLSLMGFETLLVSPFYSSPMKDVGYDIDNFVEVHPRFGTMQDFEELVASLKARGMRIVIDFVPNHTSDQHPWFECSERALIEPERCGKYRDFYIWVNSTRYEGKYPNNWMSPIGAIPAWEWSPIRQEFFLHQFLPEQPDLNLSNPLVLEELNEVLRFWLRKGVDGIRVDAVPHLFEVEDGWPDEPLNPDFVPGPNAYPYDRLIHNCTKSLPQSEKILALWRAVLHEPEFGGDKLIIAEAYDIMPKITALYGTPEHKYADMPFNIEFMQLGERVWDPVNITNIILNWTNAIQYMGWEHEKGALSPWSLWMYGNHDQSRIVNKTGFDNLDTVRFFTNMLPGVTVNYYGDELGIHDFDPKAIPEKTLKEGDPSRLPFRALMAWTPDGGFSSNPDTWLPLNEDYRVNNVQSRLAESKKNPLKNFLQLQTIRLEYMDLFTFGDLVFFENHPYETSQVLAMARTDPGLGNILMIANMSGKEERVQLRGKRSVVQGTFKKAPKQGIVLMATFESNNPSIKENQRVKLPNLTLKPYQALLIKY